MDSLRNILADKRSENNGIKAKGRMHRGWIKKTFYFLLPLFVIYIFLVVCQDIAVKPGSLKEQCDGSDVKKVLLLTYARSGSTFSSELFNQHPDVFYSFEPLITIDIPMFTQVTGNILSNQNNLAVVGKLQYSCPEIQDIINSVFACNIHRLSKSAMFHNFWMMKGSLTDVYRNCFIHGPRTWKPSNCLANNCMKSSIITVKTILLRMSVTKSLLRHHPQLKIIHLVRDPRGILMSRWKTFTNYGVINATLIEREARELCAKMLTDIELRDEISKKYKTTFFPLRYEDLAEDPLSHANEIYRFVNISFHDNVKEWLTKNHEMQDGKFGTRRHNARETSYRWRHTIPQDIASIIDDACVHVYDKLGYKRVQSLDDLRNDSYSLRVKEYRVTL
ncbi:unnamed protein product [Owenia fusiformis]|uniref:Sulfotransferase domain-containing protein n=1 Tax=Owenia fusiformis TaxID=6347 RepID=A0A8S4NFE7_OWEFU|nr:unnamed protein product [Owenia fusiformis]